MLEGNEIEKKLGEYGSVVVDIDDKFKVKVSIEAHIDLIKELEGLAEKSGKDWVVKAVIMLKGLIS